MRILHSPSSRSFSRAAIVKGGSESEEALSTIVTLAMVSLERSESTAARTVAELLNVTVTASTSGPLADRASGVVFSASGSMNANLHCARAGSEREGRCQPRTPINGTTELASLMYMPIPELTATSTTEATTAAPSQVSACGAWERQFLAPIRTPPRSSPSMLQRPRSPALIHRPKYWLWMLIVSTWRPCS